MLERAAIVVAIAVVAAFVGWWLRRARRTDDPGGRFDGRQLRAVGLDPAGANALAVLLGSPTCRPCRSVEAVLSEVAAERPGLRWVYADAGDHLDVTRAHHVLRVPTLFVLDTTGRIVARTSGVPGRRDLLQILDRPALAGDATAPPA